MAHTIIVTDSTADIPAALAEQYGIRIIPLSLFFGEETFQDGVDIQATEFYRRLVSVSVLPTTSQPSPAKFAEMYESIHVQYPEASIISLHLSSGLSGTYQSALIGKSMIDQDDHITILDSKSASYGFGMAVVHAARLAEQGKTVDEIVEGIEHILKSRSLYFIVDDLENLRKGGRIGRASAVLGTLLNVKPILSIDEQGQIYAVEKVRGQKKAMARIVEMMRQELKVDKINLALGHTADPQSTEPLLALFKEHYEIGELVLPDIGSVVGSHTGARTLGIFAWPDQP